MAIAASRGRILDASGQSVPGAQATLTNQETGNVRNSTSAESGDIKLQLGAVS